MIEETSGWFVVNVADAKWRKNAAFGTYCDFQMEGRFPQTGVNLAVLEPGKPTCRYHREQAQEDFLVLSGECLLLVNGEERQLVAWDYVHCPAGVTHVFVGAGDGPCLLIRIGHRPPKQELFYPRDEVAVDRGAATPESTPDPKVAYSDVPEWEITAVPEWPPV